MKNTRLSRATRLAAVAAGALLALNAATTAHAQAPVTTWAQSYGVGSYDDAGQPVENEQYGSGKDAPTSIAPMPDGGVVVAGQIDLPKFASDYAGTRDPVGTLVRYGVDGRIVWQTLLRLENDLTNPDGRTNVSASIIQRIRTDAAGNIYVAGSKGLGDNYTRSPFVAKFSPEGNLLWQNGAPVLRYVFPDDPHVYEASIQSPSCMDLTSDGGIIIGGSVGVQRNYNTSNFSVPYLIKFNADGTLGFHREYDSNIQYSGTVSVCPRPGGVGYAVLLPVPTGATSTTGAQGVVMLTDAVGNPVSQRIFFGGYFSGVFSLTLSADGNLFLFGRSTDGRGAPTDFFVRKLAPDLSVTWNKGYGFGSPAFSLAATADGGCIVSGSNSYNGLGLPHVFILNSDGNLRSSFALGSGSEAGGVAVQSCQTTDGSIAFTTASLAYRTGVAKADWWMVKATPIGGLPGFADTKSSGGSADLSDNSESAPEETTVYGPPPANEADPAIAPSAYPAFVLNDLNAETGLDHPNVQFQAAPVSGSIHGLFFTGEAALGSGAYYLQFLGGNPFGYFSYLGDPHYIYHFDLGYEYVFDANDGKSGVYLYDFASNSFFYTSPAFPFPYLYDFTLNTVLYYYPDPSNPGHYNTNGYRFFYRFDNGQIIVK